MNHTHRFEEVRKRWKFPDGSLTPEGDHLTIWWCFGCREVGYPA